MLGGSVATRPGTAVTPLLPRPGTKGQLHFRTSWPQYSSDNSSVIGDKHAEVSADVAQDEIKGFCFVLLQQAQRSGGGDQLAKRES